MALGYLLAFWANHRREVIAARYVLVLIPKRSSLCLVRFGLGDFVRLLKSIRCGLPNRPIGYAFLFSPWPQASLL
jgi:hypothetical protein